MEVSEGQLCARARFWASLRIDGELSELEGALLDAHLLRCSACREVADGFGSATDALRSVPLERVAPVSLHVPRSPRRLLASVAVAVVLVAGTVAGGLVRGQVSHDAAPAPHATAIIASFETPDQMRRLRRTVLLNSVLLNSVLLNSRKLPRDLVAEPV